MLQSFCEEKNIPYTKIYGFVGASTSTSINEDNWVSTKTVLETYLELRTENTLPAKLFESELDKSYVLYFISFQGHCYVMLYYFKSRISYIADRDNTYINDSDLARELEEFVGVPLVLRSYNYQYGADHCGSSAVEIGLEMTRQYHLGIKNSDIIPSKRIKERVSKLFHKDKSAPIKRNLIEFGGTPTCHICGKTFQRGKQASLKKHIYMHTAKE